MDIEQYIADSDAKRQPALRRMREICLASLPGYEESLEYNMPCYSFDGEVHVAFGNQKHYLSFYVLKQAVMDQYRDRFPKSRLGKGCIRYSNPAKIDFELLEEIVQRSFVTDSEIC